MSVASPSLDAMLATVTTAVGPVQDVEAHPAAGRSRGIWNVALTTADGPVAAILRAEAGVGPWSGTPFTLYREARYLTALDEAGVPVARPLAISPQGDWVLMTRLPGTSSSTFVDDGERVAVMRSFLRALADLHAVDPAGLDLPVPVPTEPSDHALIDLGDYVEAYGQLCPPHQEFEEVVGWLREHAPTRAPRTSLLHGDAGPGNFMHDDGRLTGFVDLELGHVGEPEDDLAWLWFRTQLLTFDHHFAEYLRWYEEFSGHPVDRDKLLYYRVMVLARCTAANLYVRAHGITGPRAGLERVLSWLRAVHAEAGGARRSNAADIVPLPSTW